MAANENSLVASEIATVYNVCNERIVGIVHCSGLEGKTGVVIVVGGRQYRTGAQRQFVRLARQLATHGYPVFRFDLRGMGDSSAEPLHFLETAPDISAAIAEFRRLAPQLDRIMLWGLCDGASAAIQYAAEHSGIDGVMMVNPWITTESGTARATLKHYYRQRLVSAGFWQKLFSGKFDFFRSLRSLGSVLQRGIRQSNVRKSDVGDSDANKSNVRQSDVNKSEDNINFEPELPDIVFAAVERFRGDVCVIISEKDLTATVFQQEYERRHVKNGIALSNVIMSSENADHTFSTPEQHDRLEKLTLDWCRQLRR